MNTKHPDDLIFDTKTLIQNLSRIQDQELATLTEKLGLTDEGEEWLFDYVFNHTDLQTFEEYLEKYGKTFGEMK
jgi:hypothetical protein